VGLWARLRLNGIVTDRRPIDGDPTNPKDPFVLQHDDEGERRRFLAPTSSYVFPTHHTNVSAHAVCLRPVVPDLTILCPNWIFVNSLSILCRTEGGMSLAGVSLEI